MRRAYLPMLSALNIKASSSGGPVLLTLAMVAADLWSDARRVRAQGFQMCMPPHMAAAASEAPAGETSGWGRSGWG